MKSREFKFRSEQDFFSDEKNVKARDYLTTKKHLNDENHRKKIEREKFERRKQSEKISTTRINFLFSFELR